MTSSSTRTSTEIQPHRNAHPEYLRLRDAVASKHGRPVSTAELAEALSLSIRHFARLTREEPTPILGFALRQIAKVGLGRAGEITPAEALQMWDELIVSRQHAGRLLGVRGSKVASRLRENPKPALMLAIAWLHGRLSVAALEA